MHPLRHGLAAMVLACAPVALAAQTAPAFRPGGAVTDTNPQPTRSRCWTGTAWADCATSSSGPTRASSTVSPPASVAVANVFQSALAANANRGGCTIQNTSGAPMLFYVGAPANATAATAFQIDKGGSFSCASPGVIITDQISVTSATAGATYVVVSQ